MPAKSLLPSIELSHDGAGEEGVWWWEEGTAGVTDFQLHQGSVRVGRSRIRAS